MDFIISNVKLAWIESIVNFDEELGIPCVEGLIVVKDHVCVFACPLLQVL